MDETTSQKIAQAADPKDHLANERTFLAWVRTSIGIMAFGFVVEKFALFIKEITLLLDKPPLSIASHPSSIQGYSSLFGILLVAFGTLISLLAFIKYTQVERQIEEHAYRPSIVLNLMLALSMVLIGIFLVIYLRGSH